MSRKIISLFLCLSFLFQQLGFAQLTAELNIAGHLAQMHSGISIDKFRPLHLRYFSYDLNSDNFKFLFDKGDAFSYEGRRTKDEGREEKSGVPHPSSLVPRNEEEFQAQAKQLLKYFLIGITLPDSKFWVNLRPDSEDQIIEPELAQTDLGKVLLEADLELKKDTARYTSPETPEGKAYWDKLYKKAEELFGYENITIPTLTRPWIVPGEIIVRETQESAFIYKSTLKVMLEEDYLNKSQIPNPKFQTNSNSRITNYKQYEFHDPRLKALNEYSTQLIREAIIPKLTKEVNTSKKYAQIRQVFYSLILSRWFKARYIGKSSFYASLIDSGNLNGLTSKEAWSKSTYFNAYQKSFKDGEYNLKEQVYTPTGQVIRSYFSGGIKPIPTNQQLTGMDVGLKGPPNNSHLSEIVSASPMEGTVLPNIFIDRQEIGNSKLAAGSPVLTINDVVISDWHNSNIHTQDKDKIEKLVKEHLPAYLPVYLEQEQALNKIKEVESKSGQKYMHLDQIQLPLLNSQPIDLLFSFTFDFDTGKGEGRGSLWRPYNEVFLASVTFSLIDNEKQTAALQNPKGAAGSPMEETDRRGKMDDGRGAAGSPVREVTATAGGLKGTKFSVKIKSIIWNRGEAWADDLENKILNMLESEELQHYLEKEGSKLLIRNAPLGRPFNIDGAKDELYLNSGYIEPGSVVNARVSNTKIAGRIDLSILGSDSLAEVNIAVKPSAGSPLDSKESRFGEYSYQPKGENGGKFAARYVEIRNGKAYTIPIPSALIDFVKQELQRAKEEHGVIGQVTLEEIGGVVLWLNLEIGAPPTNKNIDFRKIGENILEAATKKAEELSAGLPKKAELKGKIAYFADILATIAESGEVSLSLGDGGMGIFSPGNERLAHWMTDTDFAFVRLGIILEFRKNNPHKNVVIKFPQGTSADKIKERLLRETGAAGSPIRSVADEADVFMERMTFGGSSTYLSPELKERISDDLNQARPLVLFLLFKHVMQDILYRDKYKRNTGDLLAESDRLELVKSAINKRNSILEGEFKVLEISWTYFRNETIGSILENYQQSWAFFGRYEEQLLNLLKASAAGSPVQAPETSSPVGGIDFRVMNIVTQPLVASSSLNLKLPQLANLAEVNLDDELQQLKNMVSSGILPSGERIKEFLAACQLKGEWDRRIADIISCLVDVCRLEEDNVAETPVAIREALIIADSAV